MVMNAYFLSVNDENIINDFIKKYQLPLNLTIINTDKIDNKTLKKVSLDNHLPILFFDKGSLILSMVVDNEVIKTSLNWQSVQKRIVTAGKNNELILKASKLNKEMTALDGTAGFGIDSLILASTGASVLMIEQNPILFLMLVFEQQKMQDNTNWQNLMARIGIKFGDSRELIAQMPKHDVIYLDPMFPNDSYKGAVNKNMQMLHKFINPPNLNDETDLFDTAMANCDKLIIKRPISAPNFAGKSPNQSLNNEVIRFDKYEKEIL